MSLAADGTGGPKKRLFLRWVRNLAYMEKICPLFFPEQISQLSSNQFSYGLVLLLERITDYSNKKTTKKMFTFVKLFFSMDDKSCLGFFPRPLKFFAHSSRRELSYEQGLK
mgnify:CR=1 FL=1